MDKVKIHPLDRDDTSINVVNVKEMSSDQLLAAIRRKRKILLDSEASKIHPILLDLTMMEISQLRDELNSRFKYIPFLTLKK